MQEKLRIMVNDYAGHPFQVELSDELAQRGHETLHTYCSTNVTPRGDFDREASGLIVEGISTGSGFDKYSAGRRLVAEVRYGVGSIKHLLRHRPQVCLNSNVPILSLALITLVCKALRIRPVLWLQDFQSGLIAMALKSESHPITRVMTAVEHWCIRSADSVVAISEGFEHEVLRLGVPEGRVSTISNWAPLDEVPVLSRDNDWATQHGLDTAGELFVYSGTMGIKHRPEALIALAGSLSEQRPQAKIVIVSEGVGAEWLADQAQARALQNFVFLPFQPFERLPEVLASADALVVLLEPDAGEFSVPSKVLTYLCAARPIVGLMPLNNAASRLVSEQAQAGLVADSDEEFVNCALELLENPSRAIAFGQSGRAYAEREFDRRAIADRFLGVLRSSESNAKKPTFRKPFGQLANINKMEIRK